MLRKIRSYLGVLIGTLVFAPANAETITTEMRCEDARLTTSVTFTAPRIQIGELLDKLSEMTGVRLKADSRDGAADPKIAVFLRNAKLGDALDALWSLVSYRGATWHWRRDGVPGGFTYTLMKPRRSRGLASQLQNWVQEAFEHEADALMELAWMMPKERKKSVGKLQDIMLEQDQRAMVAELPAQDRMWAGLRMFSETVSPDVRKQVLRGEARPVIPVGELSEEGKAFVRAVWEASRGGYLVQSDGTRLPIPEPKTVMFYRSSDSNGTPVFCIGLESLGAYGYAGAAPLGRMFRHKMGDLWMLPRDKSEDPAQERVCSEVPMPTDNWDRQRILPRLEQLAFGTSVSILARLPARKYNDPGSPEGLSVCTFLMERIQERSVEVNSKWRRGILLLASPAWIMYEAPTPSYDVVKSLREAQKNGDGYISFADLVEATRGLSLDQLMELKEEFPVVGAMAPIRDLLVLIAPTRHHLARLQSERGLTLTEAALAAMRERPYFRQAFTAYGDPKAVRVTEKEAVGTTPERRMIEFAIQTRDGQWRPVFGFANPKHGESTKPASATPAAPAHVR